MYIQQMVNRDSLDNRCIKKKIIINYTSKKVINDGKIHFDREIHDFES